MTNEFTPTMGGIRDCYVYMLDDGNSSSGRHEALREFNRWLAAHDAEVAATALREAADSLEAWETVGGRYLVAACANRLRDRADELTVRP
jgi:hypothetical protein